MDESARAPLLVGDEQHRQLGERRPAARPAPARRPSDSTTPPFMSAVPGPYSRSPSRRSGAWESCAITVSTWPSSSIRPEPVPAIRATRSAALPGVEHGTRSISRLRGQQRRAQRDRLLGAVDVARGRGDRRPAPRARAGPARRSRRRRQRSASPSASSGDPDLRQHARRRRSVCGAPALAACRADSSAQRVVDRRRDPVQAAEQRDLAVQVVGLDRAGMPRAGSARSKSPPARSAIGCTPIRSQRPSTSLTSSASNSIPAAVSAARPSSRARSISRRRRALAAQIASTALARFRAAWRTSTA